MSDGDEDDKYRAPALSKGLDILELLAADTMGLSQIEIAAQMGISVNMVEKHIINGMLACKKGLPERDTGKDRA